MQSKSVSKMLMMTAPVVAVCGFLMTASLAQAEDRPGQGRKCSNATLNGAYGLTIDATTAPGPGLLFRGVVLQSYDGDGHLTIRDHIVFDGTPETDSWTPGTGVYLVHPDCTGIAEVNSPNSPVPLNLAFVVVRQGKEIHSGLDSIVIATVFTEVE